MNDQLTEAAAVVLESLFVFVVNQESPVWVHAENGRGESVTLLLSQSDANLIMALKRLVEREQEAG